MMERVLYEHPSLGNIYIPEIFKRGLSLPGRPTRGVYRPGEVGIFVAAQQRPKFVNGILQGFETIWSSITHNERVDRGAIIQDVNCFGTPSTAFTAVAVVGPGGTITVTKTDESLGIITPDVTTNEYTTIGLSRAAGSLGTYTPPASLGAVFSRIITKTFTASGSGTAFGAGLFDDPVVSGSFLYVEDNFASTAVLVTDDTLQVDVTISN